MSFTGSYGVGTGIYQKTAKRMIRTQLEMGGKNPLIVAADADLDKAVTLAARGWLRPDRPGLHRDQPRDRRAGGRTRVHRASRRPARSLKVGPGLQSGLADGPGRQQGPARDRPRIYRDRPAGRREAGRRRRQEGRRRARRVTLSLRPSSTEVRPDMRIAQEEIFGPVIVDDRSRRFRGRDADRR